MGHRLYAQVAQSVEHVLGKDEVSGSIPLLGLVRLMFDRELVNPLGGRDEQAKV
jgi:hypothetical protein